MCNPILRPASGHLWGVENDRGVGHRRQRVQLGRAWTSGLCAGQCRLYNMHRSQSAEITGGIRPYRRVGLASPNRRASTECSAHWSFEACAAAIQSTLLPESWPPEPTASELRPVRPGHRIPEPVPWVCGNVYHMRMARVNITVPDELYDKARERGPKRFQGGSGRYPGRAGPLGQDRRAGRLPGRARSTAGTSRRQRAGRGAGFRRTGFSGPRRTAAQHDDRARLSWAHDAREQPRARLEELRRRGEWPAVVPTVVLAESLTGDHRRDYHENRVLRTCDLRPVDEALARSAAFLRAQVTGRRSPSAVDAIVVALADLVGGATVLSSDPADLRPLPATRCTKSTWHLLDTEAIAGPPPAVASHARNNNHYGAHSSHPTTCLFRSHDDGDALWERGYDRRQNVRRAGRNIYARSDVDSPTAPRAIFSRRSTAVCWWRERTRQRQPT